MIIRCEHHEPVPIDKYLAAYVAKRRDDSKSQVKRLDNGVLEYNLAIDFPAWLRKLLSIPEISFTERIQSVDGISTIVSRCDEADVTVTLLVITEGLGTCVKCTVELEPKYKGIKVPELMVRSFVKNRFAHERARDRAYVVRLGS